MPHLHDQPGQHDTTVSAFIVRLDSDEPRLLLHEHKLLGALLQFGSHVELHETPWAAIRHELEEESGYGLSQLCILQPQQRLKGLQGSVLHPQPAVHYTHPFHGRDHFHSDIAYAFITTEQPQAKPAEGESTAMQAFTPAELADLPAERIYDDVRTIGTYIMAELVGSWEEVATEAYE